MTKQRRPAPARGGPQMTSTAKSMFEAASAHFRADRLAEAKVLFKDLATKGFRPGLCCHFMALIAQQRGQHRKALELFDRAAALDPADVSVHANHGNLLAMLGQTDAALGSFDRALALRPAQAEVLCNRGNALHSLGRLPEALAAYEQALALRADLAEAWDGQGNSLVLIGEGPRALASYDRALLLQPDNPTILYNRANALHGLDRHAEAAAGYDRAIGLRPNWAQALNNRANALLALGRETDALAGYDRALAAEPGHAGAARNRADLLRVLRRYDVALAGYDQVLTLLPCDAEAWCGRGNVLLDMGQHDAALAAYGQALALVPGHAAARYGQAMARLARGMFADGWDDYEERWGFLAFLAQQGAASPHQRYRLRPAPADVSGRDIVVVREQGIGDEVMFASILPDLLRDARRVTYVGDARLTRLFENSFPAAEIAGADNFDPLCFGGCDAVIPVASLGYLYRRDSAGFSGRPYLAPRAAVAAEWQRRIERPDTHQGKHLRVGLSWRGGTRQTRTNERSLSLEELRPLLDLPGCDFISLQYGDVTAEVAAFNAGRDNPVRLFPRAEIEDFEDLAGLIQALDSVVSVQNSVVHLSGALGKDCLAMVPANPEWRYGAAGDRMVWYRSVRLFRQARDTGWDAVVDAVAAAVAARQRDA